MRKINSIVTIAIMVLFVIHLVWGAMELFGMIKGGSAVFSMLSRLLATLIVIHIVIGVKTTADSLKAMRLSGVSYFKENRLFWIRRVSGLALMLFMIVHIIIFMGRHIDGTYVLVHFDALKLISQILLVVSLLVHLATNIRPLRIALGLSDGKNVRTDVMVVLAVLLAIAGTAFVIYYIRWMVI